MKIGQGLDVHRFSSDASRPLWIGLVRVDGARGLEGHSDADVATHALCDAMLGAANLGDLGRHFPDSDDRIKDISSRDLLTLVVAMINGAGLFVESADITIVAQQPQLAAHMPEMSRKLSEVVGTPVSVKATTTEGLGAIGRGEGIGANAVVLLGELS